MSRKIKKYGWIPNLPDQRSAHYPLAELEIALHVCSFSRLRVLSGLQPLTTTAYPLRVLRESVRERVGSHLYATPQPVLAKLPKKVDLRSLG